MSKNVNNDVSMNPPTLQPRSQGLSSLPLQRPRKAEKRDPGNEVAYTLTHLRRTWVAGRLRVFFFQARLPSAWN